MLRLHLLLDRLRVEAALLQERVELLLGQSEFLQLATFTIAAAYLVYKGSSESPDSDERIGTATVRSTRCKERGLAGRTWVLPRGD